MVGPIADSRDLVGQRRQPAGEEIAERLAAGIDVASVPVDKIHRDIEHIVDIALEAETDHAEPELVANLVHLAEMLMDLITGLMNRLERRAAQLELAAGLERDRTARVVCERDRVAALDDRLPTEAGHLAQQHADPG